MISFLEKNCASLFGKDEEALIRNFRELTRDERAFVVRLANRSDTVFRVSGLKYKELPELGTVMLALAAAGFIRQPTPVDGMGIIATLNRSELVDLLRPLKGLSSKTKAELLQMMKAKESVVLSEELLEQFVVQQRVETLDYLFFLYFGKHRRNLQALALRDLGILKTRSGQAAFEVRFPTREGATLAFFYAKVSLLISDTHGAGLVALAAGLTGWPVCHDATSTVARDREICRLGARLEQAGFSDDALSVYRYTASHPARERICRILLAKKQGDEAKRLLEEMISNPSTDEELLFAEDFHARKFGKRNLSRLTLLLRSAPVIEMDEAFRDSAEDAAVEHFKKKGERAYRTENHLWASLFGLLFWDQLQGENGETKHNEFEHRPTQLTDGSFFRKNEVAIHRQFALLHTAAALPHLEGVMESHSGKPNGVFRWKRNTAAVVRELITHGSPHAIEAVLRRIAQDPCNNCVGFPDLMVVAGEVLRFVEIKAEGDQIRRHQLVQLQALEKAGFPVEVVRVEWFADPDQEYVVVDVETTGGRAAQHRVTEIGAVKVRRGRVTEKFSTLVNPERRIPGNISRLTGICDAMVADAPKFQEIAESFREFVGKAVFVAHNAQFDYSFLREEFRRLGQNFRCPTLCTVVATRKYFPGLPSYSLAGLTQYFGIPLASHHRALCDAEATAELLILINGLRTRSISIPQSDHGAGATAETPALDVTAGPQAAG